MGETAIHIGLQNTNVFTAVVDSWPLGVDFKFEIRKANNWSENMQIAVIFT